MHLVETGRGLVSCRFALFGGQRIEHVIRDGLPMPLYLRDEPTIRYLAGRVDATQGPHGERSIEALGLEKK